MTRGRSWVGRPPYATNRLAVHSASSIYRPHHEGRPYRMAQVVDDFPDYQPRTVTAADGKGARFDLIGARTNA